MLKHGVGWSHGVECFFGVAFLQNKSCVLIPESADALGGTQSQATARMEITSISFHKKACLTVSNSF